ncbi:MAG: VWA domain-containing protein [Methylacidiphilales bacterium]|nr:VWA domain-containing protein [Candidatus Methylacidiphilales bacterium]
MISELWDLLDPGFFAPVWLLIGAVAVIAVVLLEIGARRRRKQAVRLFAASHLVAALTGSVSPLKRLLKSVLLAAAVGLLFVAMARPHLFFDWQDENRSGLDVLIAVDCSKSMLTEDVKPNRIERAKLAIADFADHLPDNRLGLIAFAGDAFLQCPLTLDHDAFQTAVRELDTDTIPRPGTDIAAAIDQAVDALKSQPYNMKFLILVTDGEDLEGRAIDAAKNAAQSGLKIYTVGVGTPNGDRIPERDDSGAVMYHQDANGQDVVSKLDESTLRQIADLTGGAYAPLGQRGEGLDEIYSRYIEPLPKQNLEQRREKIPIEQFEWPLGLAILFLMLEFLINERAGSPVTTFSSPASLPPRRRPARAVAATTPLLAVAMVLSGTARASDADTAERDYKSGQYEEAMQNYEKAVETRPDRSDLQYNRGDAAYKAGEYSDAEEAFRKALETPDLGLQEKSYYNLGNAQYQHGAAMQIVDVKKTINLWEKALHSYDSALKLRTTADALHNYKFVKEKLEELKKQQKQQQQKDQNGQSNPDDQDQSGKSSSQGQGDQGDNQPQNQPGRNNPQNGGQNSSQPPQQQPDDKNGRQSSAGSKDANSNQLKTYSGTRTQDQQDPGIKSRQDAENLLDSLKDDERHVTARALNALNNQNQPPPPASGKDW